MLAPLSVVGVIRYARPARAFTALRNDFVRNARVSLRAFRVGAFVLSHVDGFVLTQKTIARETGLSITTVRAALEDLRRDRYLVSRRVREGGRWTGTAYAVSDVPFTEAELAELCPPGAESEGTESEHSRSTPPKNTTPVRETTSHKRTNPSGGAPADAAASAGASDAQKDEDMPPRTTEPTLFDVPAPQAETPGRTPVQRVVAAFVASHESHHGQRPSRSEIGRVARDTTALLQQASEEQLTAAATAMGQTPFANLAVQLKITKRHARAAAPLQTGDSPVWQDGLSAVAQEAATLAFQNPEIAAMLARQAATA
jgi:hypothetical protein